MHTPLYDNNIRGKRLARLATDRGFSLRRLAARLGVTPSSLGRLERGRPSGLSEDTLRALAAELGENPDELLALAGMIPADVRAALLARPAPFAALIRGLAGRPDGELAARLDASSILAAYRETQRLARVGSFTRDLEGGGDQWSEEFFRIVGLPMGAHPRTFEEYRALVHPEDRPVLDAVHNKLLTHGGPFHYAYRFRRGDGVWRHAKAVASSERDASGRAARIHGTIQDVTAERRAMDNLRAVASFPEHSPRPVLRVTREGLLAYANAAAGSLLEALGMAVGEPVAPAVAGLLARAANAPGQREIDLPCDGHVLAFTVALLPARECANLYGRDVTGERAAQAALAAAEARCRRLFEDAPHGAFRATPDGRLTAVNPALARLCGHDTPGDMLREAGAGDPLRLGDIARRLREEGGEVRFEAEFRRRDGSVRIAAIQARLVGNAGGEETLEGFAEDITAGRQARRLAASEERLQARLRNVPLPTLTFQLRDRELVLADANKAAEALFRGRIGACLDAQAGAIFDEYPEIYLALWSALEGRRPEKRRVSFRPPGAAAPGIFDMTAVFTPPDTVMLHAAEIPLPERIGAPPRQPSEHLRGVFGDAPFAAYIQDPAGRFLMVNRAAEHYLGLPESEIVGRPAPDLIGQRVAARAVAENGGGPGVGRAVVYEEEITARGCARPFLTTKLPLFDEEGRHYATCGLSVDITAFKKQEREIAAERDALRDALDRLPLAACLAGPDGTLEFRNKAFEALSGQAARNLPDIGSWLARACPDGSSREQARAPAAGERRVLPLRRADGRICRVELLAEALPDGRTLLTVREADRPGEA